MQGLQSGFAALGDAGLQFGVHGARVGLDQRLGGDRRILRADGNGEAVSLAGLGGGTGLMGSVECSDLRTLAMKIIFHRFFELIGSHAVGLLDGFFDRKVLVQDESEVSSSFGQLLFMEQIVDDDPGFGVVERVMRALVAAGGVVLYGEQVGQREPDLGAKQIGE